MLATFKKYLLSNNIEIQKEDDITISFEKNGFRYLFLHDKSDPFYFRLILPNILKVPNDNNESLLKSINSANVKFKVAKAVIMENSDVWISVEQFVYSMEKIDDLFGRSIILLETFLNDFRKLTQS